MVMSKESGFYSYYRPRNNTSSPLTFKFLETSGTHLWDYVIAIVKYRQCLAHSLHQNACSTNINSFPTVNKYFMYRDYLSSTYAWKSYSKDGKRQDLQWQNMPESLF